jgi:hypothetical protein
MMRFLPMNQMTMEVVRIVELGRSRISWSTLAEIALNMRCVMIDNDDHSPRLTELAGGRSQPPPLEIQSGYSG